MKNVLLWALVALNALLLVSLLGRWPENTAMAQPRPAMGRYMACPGEIVGAGAGGEVVYILDTSNLVLTAVQQANRDLNIMPPIDLRRELGR